MTKKLKIIGPYTPEHEGPFCTRDGQSEPLPTIGYISHIVADAMRDPTSGINTTQLRAEPNGGVSESLVFRSDALAKLAEKDAEIARYREALREIIDTAHNIPEFMRIETMQKEAELALKGSES